MKVFQGIVTSVKDQKTVRVVVARTVKHPLYLKLIRRTKSYICENTAKAELNDFVSIRETRPLSASKRFEVISIDQKGATTDNTGKQAEEMKSLEKEIIASTPSKIKKENKKQVKTDESEESEVEVAEKPAKSEKAVTADKTEVQENA